MKGEDLQGEGERGLPGPCGSDICPPGSRRPRQAWDSPGGRPKAQPVSGFKMNF